MLIVTCTFECARLCLIRRVCCYATLHSLSLSLYYLHQNHFTTVHNVCVVVVARASLTSLRDLDQNRRLDMPLIKRLERSILFKSIHLEVAWKYMRINKHTLALLFYFFKEKLYTIQRCWQYDFHEPLENLRLYLRKGGSNPCRYMLVALVPLRLWTTM